MRCSGSLRTRVVTALLLTQMFLMITGLSMTAPVAGSTRTQRSNVAGNGMAGSVTSLVFAFGTLSGPTFISENEMNVTSVAYNGTYPWGDTLTPPAGGKWNESTKSGMIYDKDHVARITPTSGSSVKTSQHTVVFAQ